KLRCIRRRRPTHLVRIHRNHYCA
ncbi:hypothetical protein D046_1235B, partial [Vibrio parahaemolyticus V-223/04]